MRDEVEDESSLLRVHSSFFSCIGIYIRIYFYFVEAKAQLYFTGLYVVFKLSEVAGLAYVHIYGFELSLNSECAKLMLMLTTCKLARGSLELEFKL